MKRLWEAAVTSQGIKRLSYYPLLITLWLVTPIYQFFSRRQLNQRRAQCSGEWDARVVSIGNITVGGSGKTPIVGYLARQIANRGKKIVIVHSGYGRKSTDLHLIGYGKGREYSVEDIGDETAMMARQIPGVAFAIGRDKKKTVSLADQKLGPDVIIIDDGYQRLDIKKDVDIVVVNDEIISHLNHKHHYRGFHPFPSGFLREKLTELARADAIFVTRSSSDSRDRHYISVLKRYNNKAPVIVWNLMISSVEHSGEKKGLDILEGKRPYLFAGIGSFPRLKRMAEDAGIVTSGNISFGDHAEYNDSTLAELIRNSTSTGADSYLTTAKDMVKLPSSGLDKPVYCLRLTVEPDDVSRLVEIIGLDAS